MLNNFLHTFFFNTYTIHLEIGNIINIYLPNITKIYKAIDFSPRESCMVSFTEITIKTCETVSCKILGSWQDIPRFNFYIFMRRKNMPYLKVSFLVKMTPIEILWNVFNIFYTLTRNRPTAKMNSQKIINFFP